MGFEGIPAVTPLASVKHPRRPWSLVSVVPVTALLALATINHDSDGVGCHMP